MAWTIRIAAAVALLWGIYAASPYVAAYRLARAVQARESEAIQARVNFRSVRLSLAKQILAAYLVSSGEGSGSDAMARAAAVAAVDVAEPLLAQLLSPELLIDLLDDGWPQTLVPEKTLGAPAASASGSAAGTISPAEAQSASRVGLGSPRFSWSHLFFMVDMRGFRRFNLLIPSARGSVSHLQLQFRFEPWRWRLVGIEIPSELALRLAGELRNRIGKP